MSSLDEKYKKFHTSTKEWLSSLAISDIEPERSLVEDILSMSINDLREKDQKELAEYTFVLCQYSYFLQNKSNECESFLNWSKNYLNSFIGEEKFKLINWIKKIEIRSTRIRYLSKKIEMISQSLSNLSRIKRDEPN